MSREASSATLKIPHHFKCPITGEIMRDPVVCVDGQTYDRKAIEEWFKNKQTSPATGCRLSSKTLVQNIALRESIREFLNLPEVESLLRETVVTLSADNTNAQEKSVIRGRVDTLREKAAPWIAFASKYSEDIFLNVFLGIASTMCMVFAGYALAQVRRVANAPNYPIEVGTRFSAGATDLYTAVTRCDDLARTNQVAVDFAIKAKIPANQTNATYQLMMGALQFACGLITNVTMNGYIFTPTYGNVCNDVPRSSSTGCYSENNVCYDYAHTNSGALKAMFAMLAQITQTPLLGLNCQGPENATSEDHWILVFALMALAAAASGFFFFVKGAVICEKKDAFFRELAQARAEAYAEEMTVLANAVV